MKDFVSLFPNHEKMVLGFNYGTLLTLISMAIAVVIIRFLACKILPKVFKKVSEHSQKASDALTGSGKALGVAIGSGLILSLIHI